jgi:hypothetical protein
MYSTKLAYSRCSQISFYWMSLNVLTFFTFNINVFFPLNMNCLSYYCFEFVCFHSSMRIPKQFQTSEECYYPFASYELISNWNVRLNRPYKTFYKHFFSTTKPICSDQKSQNEDFRFFSNYRCPFSAKSKQPEKEDRTNS